MTVPHAPGRDAHVAPTAIPAARIEFRGKPGEPEPPHAPVSPDDCPALAALGLDEPIGGSGPRWTLRDVIAILRHKGPPSEVLGAPRLPERVRAAFMRDWYEHRAETFPPREPQDYTDAARMRPARDPRPDDDRPVTRRELRRLARRLRRESAAAGAMLGEILARLDAIQRRAG